MEQDSACSTGTDAVHEHIARCSVGESGVNAGGAGTGACCKKRCRNRCTVLKEMQVVQEQVHVSEIKRCSW